ncbi:hypothetical protein [Mesorhizobium ciceri]|uniref:hypothetical protein n=1 Tax=Mesorhizobium ciceri TaxID=39645 RepID=UPI0002D51F85|nr:hypothetical protein [Mesorhizobium ciceri]
MAIAPVAGVETHERHFRSRKAAGERLFLRQPFAIFAPQRLDLQVAEVADRNIPTADGDGADVVLG